MDREICRDICTYFFKSCGGTNCPLQLWSSSPRIIFYWISWKFSFPKQGKNENLVPWYRDNKKDYTGQHPGETHPTSQSTREKWADLAWIKMIVRTKIVPLLSSYRSKRINHFICRSIWNDIAKYYLCRFSTVQNEISV